ncbi:hypothetical protein F0L17_12375 [Streptomyces sp. TRM43335]|uniref:CU044_5270 family protein n=1 Tax=Streptomyces taklimakanensis TaxID=2569853 RepID=A0A6G2BC98_9ACTN|nr:CU044_5270 family protein [Streptomyces taklimakanensis]MTE19897.1 hypothetical protein [Streptomyces taklimakanensis]
MTTPTEHPEHPELPRPGERDLPPGRRRLLREHLMTEVARDGRTDAPPAPRPRRLRPSLVTGTVAAAVVATLTVALPSDLPDRGAPPASREAVVLLEEVAYAAEHRKVPDGIRDDQFVYVESLAAHSRHEEGRKAVVEPVHRREAWRSVDGTRWGRAHADSEYGPLTFDLEPETPGIPANTNYRRLQTLPTDPGEMLDWLYATSEGGAEGDDQDAFELVSTLVRESLLPPDVAAALFRAVARIPGVVLVEDSVDAAGRHGVAVARENRGERVELIFDRRTKVYLGERVVATEDSPDGLREGQVIGRHAVLERGIVDEIGERPRRAGGPGPVTRSPRPR